MTAFAVFLDDPSQEQSTALTAAMRTLGVSWWHHMHGLWLLADHDASRDFAWWFGFVGTVVPKTSVMVVEITEGARWAGRVPTPALAWLEKIFSGERFEFPQPQLAPGQK